MLTAKYIEEELGYSSVRVLPDGRWLGLMQMTTTMGLFVGIDATGYSYRYCYQNRDDAIKDIVEWDGTGDPTRNWIKRKGLGQNYSNPNHVPDGKDDERRDSLIALLLSRKL